VKSEILALIADLVPGSTMPTERELAERFETSRTTVRQAIAELVVDGRVERTQGRGTFVAQPKLMQVRQLTSFSRDLQAQGQRPGSVMLRIDEQPADDEVSAHLELAPGTPIHRVERLRTAARAIP
jgi:GntR family transcriptional regulator